MKRNRVIINLIVLAILAGAVLIAYLYIQSKPEPRKRAKAASTLSIKASKEKVADFPITISYPARVASQDVVALGVEVGGRIERGDVALKQGETFKKGELLFSINRDDINARLMSAKSKFLTTISQVLPDINLDLNDEYSKWNNFFNSISLEKKMPPLPEINGSKERVYIASNNIISQYYDIISLEISLDKHEVYAPFDGVFTSVTKEVGAIVSANSQLGTISSTNRLEVVVAVSLEDVGRIKEGDEAEVISRMDDKFKGAVKRVSSYVEPRTQMVDVYVHIFDSEKNIIEGEMVDVNLSAGTLTNVIKIPNEAIANNGVIYLIDSENSLRSKNVNIEYEIGEWTYISGVDDNSVIVQESIITPVEGMKVNIIDIHIE